MKTKQVKYNPPCSLESAYLSTGSHSSPEEGMCFMELYACVYERPWSDHDETVSPVVAAFQRSWNDSLDDKTRQKLKAYIHRVHDTNDSHNDRRAWMCLDWLTRECAPAFLELTASLKHHADSLRSLPEIVDRKALEVANVPLAGAAAAARDAARAADRGIRDPDWSATWSAAWAWSAAAAADAAAAGAAAAGAGPAWSATRDAARVAAGRTLTPVISRVQESAFRLLDRMCDVGKHEIAA